MSVLKPNPPTLEDVRLLLESVNVSHDVEYVTSGVGSPSVYVNWGHNLAVCIEPSSETDGWFQVTAYAWDRTGGVSAETEIGQVSTPESVVDLVFPWIERQEDEQRRIEAVLAASFGFDEGN